MITRPFSDDEKVNYITSHLEGQAREEIRYWLAVEKKKPQDILAIYKEVFRERGATSELLSISTSVSRRRISYTS